MINLEQPTTQRLDKILINLKDGQYIIPDFQRDYDWSAKDINELLISIFSDYYIGNLLLWDTKEANIKALDCKNIKGCPKENLNSSTIVLDGQQRLTSLNYAFFKPSFSLKGRKTPVEFFLKIDDFLKGDIDKAFFFEWKKNKLSLLNNIDYLVKNRIYPLSNFFIILQRNNDWADKFEEVYGKNETDSLINKLSESCAYEIPIITLKRDIDISKVCDIFEKINSKGVKLSTFDLLNSILKQHGIKLRTDLWQNAEKLLKFIDDDNKMYLLQNMSIVEQNYCSPKYLYYLIPKASKTIKKENGTKEDIVLINNKEVFDCKWNEAVNSLIKAEELLQDPSNTGYGVLQKKFLPYVSMLPVFAALLSFLTKNKSLDTAINRNKLRKWWFYSIFENNYSSSVESTMAKDYQDMCKWFQFQDTEIIEAINSFAVKLEENLNLNNQKPGSAIYNAILNLIITNGAKNFYEDASLTLNNLEDHHIVPKEFCERIGIKAEKYNSILNRTLIYDSTNNNIKDSAPSEYIKNKIIKKYSNIESVKNMFEKHFISEKAFNILLKDDFNAENFEEFINERNLTILNYIKENIYEIKPNTDFVS